MSKKIIEAAREAERLAYDELGEGKKRITDRIRAEWLAAGGCPKCGGKGRLCGTDFDGYSWDNGPCEGFKVGEVIHGSPVRSDTVKNEHGYDATVAYRPHSDVSVDALSPRSHDKHGLVEDWSINRDIPCTSATCGKCPTTITTPEDLRTVADLDESYGIAKDLREAAERDFTPHKGATVIVKRGRKVPQGTTGVIVWTEEQHFGGVHTRRDGILGGRATLRIGIKVEGQDKLQYTSGDNVDVLSPSPAVLLPSLSGSDKQVSWAERIRLDAIAGGSATQQELEGQWSARFWIDNRERFARKGQAA